MDKPESVQVNGTHKMGFSDINRLSISVRRLNLIIINKKIKMNELYRRMNFTVPATTELKSEKGKEETST